MGDPEGPLPKGAKATGLSERARSKRRKTIGRTERLLKIVGAATAVLSLGAALYGLGHFLYGRITRTLRRSEPNAAADRARANRV
jgi:hypothetical protein